MDDKQEMDANVCMLHYIIDVSCVASPFIFPSSLVHFTCKWSEFASTNQAQPKVIICSTIQRSPATLAVTFWPNFLCWARFAKEKQNVKITLAHLRVRRCCRHCVVVVVCLCCCPPHGKHFSAGISGNCREWEKKQPKSTKRREKYLLEIGNGK